ncbi:glutaredoxin domain-containing protein [Mycobacteroides abscessus]|nr:glutaredoxin domain-containing protein [Mycobacteroides abscessus]
METDCPNCTAVMTALDKHGVEYEVLDSSK